MIFLYNEIEDLDTIIADLRAENVRLLAYVNPYLNTDGDMFEEAAMMNYLLKDKAGEILIQDHAGFYAGTVDLSNPEAFQWYSGIDATILHFIGLVFFLKMKVGIFIF